MMRVADYIANFVADSLKCDTVFLVTGGGMMFLSDGLACCPRLKTICMHHEQAAAMAATGFAKCSSKFGCAMVTTGCGGTNAITGLLNAWQDGAKVFFISGQVKRKQTIRKSGLPLRQFGVQEADIVEIVRSITKYAVMVDDPQQIAWHLEKARFLAETGTPGPVWIDVPMDVQGSVIDELSLPHFERLQSCTSPNLEKSVSLFSSALSHAKRPVILAGQGIDQSGAKSLFYDLLEKWNVPVVTSFLGGNSIACTHPCYIGRIGTKGNRDGNLTVQNADLLLVLGCRLSVSTTGYEFDEFARKAEIFVVDLDETVYRKNTVPIDHFIPCDLRVFLKTILPLDFPARPDWLRKTTDWKQRYHRVDCGTKGGRGIYYYDFLEDISEILSEFPGSVVVSDAGSSFYAVTQSIRLNDTQRYITSGGQAEMGFSLPGAIGAAASQHGLNVVSAITGDGSLQMNIQELQTLKHTQFPIKLFVWNNNGYLSIRATQRKFFQGRFIGTDSSCGVSFPELAKIADAYGLPFVRISDHDSMKDKIRNVVETEGPVICEVICDPDQEIVPTVSSAKLPDGTMKSLPLEDMYPFLPREELAEIMKD